MESDERAPLIGANDGSVQSGKYNGAGTSNLLTIPEGVDGHHSPISNGNHVTFPIGKEETRWNRFKDRIKDSTLVVKIKSIKIPPPVFNILLSILTVLGMVCLVISIPMFTGSMASGGSDPYIGFLLATMWFPVVFFAQLLFFKFFIDRTISLKPAVPWTNVVIVGILSAMNGILQAFSSLPENTPPYLQGILSNMLIPFTVIARLIVVRKGINRKQLVCLLVLGIGIFISLEPTIFSMDAGTGEPTSHGKWYFIILFALSFLPNAIAFVYMEKGQKTYGGDPMSYMAWAMVFLYGTYLVFFWVDFIPGFGLATTSSDFVEKLKTGILCFYGAGGKQCSNVPGRAAFFISSFAAANFFNMLLIKFAEGAVYAVVVLALVTPLATIFWTLFAESPTFHFHPSFSTNTLYVLGGLVIMMPAVVMYTAFSEEEPEEPVRPQRSRTLSQSKRRIIKAHSTPNLQALANQHNNPT